MKILGRLLRRRKGAAMVEYGLLVGGVALVLTATISVLGNKTNDIVAAMAAVLPGAHPDDNNPITGGELVEFAPNADGNIALDVSSADGILANSNTERLGNNLGIGADIVDLVVED